MASKQKVAVYGTLKLGHCNNHCLGYDARILSQETIEGFGMYSLGAFPAVRPEEGTIHIEVWEISDLGPLDILEGYPRMYNRKKVKTSVGDAWLYIGNFNFNGLTKVENGEW